MASRLTWSADGICWLKKTKDFLLTKYQENRKDIKARQAYKAASRKATQYTKIQRVFGGSTYHNPNQLLRKELLPKNGLCQVDVLYALACRLDELQYLYDIKLLCMKPFAFLQWRISEALSTNPNACTGPSRRRLITSIASFKQSNGSQDPVDLMSRRVALFCADMQHHRSNWVENAEPSSTTPSTTGPSENPAMPSPAVVSAIVQGVHEQLSCEVRPPVTHRQEYFGVNHHRAALGLSIEASSSLSQRRRQLWGVGRPISPSVSRTAQIPRSRLTSVSPATPVGSRTTSTGINRERGQPSRSRSSTVFRNVFLPMRSQKKKSSDMKVHGWIDPQLSPPETDETLRCRLQQYEREYELPSERQTQ